MTAYAPGQLLGAGVGAALMVAAPAVALTTADGRPIVAVAAVAGAVSLVLAATSTRPRPFEAAGAVAPLTAAVGFANGAGWGVAGVCGAFCAIEVTAAVRRAEQFRWDPGATKVIRIDASRRIGLGLAAAAATVLVVVVVKTVEPPRWAGTMAGVAVAAGGLWAAAGHRWRGLSRRRAVPDEGL